MDYVKLRVVKIKVEKMEYVLSMVQFCQCKIYGCENQRKKNRVCVTHGATVSRCKIDGRKNGSAKRGVCIAHGATKPRCKIDGCKNQRVKDGVCIKHRIINV